MDWRSDRELDAKAIRHALPSRARDVGIAGGVVATVFEQHLRLSESEQPKPYTLKAAPLAHAVNRAQLWQLNLCIVSFSLESWQAFAEQQAVISQHDLALSRHGVSARGAGRAAGNISQTCTIRQQHLHDRLLVGRLL